MANSLIENNVDNKIGIVETGDTCTHSGGIAAGQYVIWKGVLYTADAAIDVGETLVASGGSKNLTACSDGGLNALYNVKANKRWKLLGEASYNNDTTLPNFNLYDYSEILIVLSMASSTTQDIVASTVMSAYLSNLTSIRARYKTDSNESRDAVFNVTTKKLSSLNSGYTAYLYVR